MSYSTGNLATAEFINRWEAMLGGMRKHVEFNAHDNIPKVAQTLAELSAGENKTLGMRIDTNVENTNHWVLQIVAPISITTNELGAERTTLTFLPELLEENPAGGVPRTLTYTSNTIKKGMQRRGAGLKFDLEFAADPRSASIIALQIAQISHSIAETIRIDVIYAMLHAPDDYNAHLQNYGEGSVARDAEEVLAQEIYWYNFAQYIENGVQKWVGEGRNQVVERVGAPDLDTLILPYHMANIMQTVPKSGTEYRIGGPTALDTLNNKDLVPTRFRDDTCYPLWMEQSDTMLFFCRPVITEDMGLVQLLETTSEFGQYALMCYPPEMVDENFTSAHRSIQIHDEDAKCMKTITQADAIKHCGLWGNDGRPLGCPRNGNIFKSMQRGSKATQDYVPWFLSSYITPHLTIGAAFEPQHPGVMAAVGKSVMKRFSERERADFETLIGYLQGLNSGNLFIDEDAPDTVTTDNTKDDAGRMADYRARGVIGQVCTFQENPPLAGTATVADFTLNEGNPFFDQPMKSGADEAGYLTAGAWNLVTQAGLANFTGGRASAQYLDWAANGGVVADAERDRARVAIATLNTLIAKTDEMFPNNPLTSAAAAIPYMLPLGVDEQYKRRQAMIETLLGGVTGMVFARFNAAGTDATANLEHLDAAIRIPFQNAIGVANFGNGRNVGLGSIVQAMYRMTGNETARFAEMLADQRVQQYLRTIVSSHVSESPTQPHQIAVDGLLAKFREFFPPTRGQEADRSSQERSLRSPLLRLQREVPGAANVGGGTPSIFDFVYLPYTWPSDRPKKPILIVKGAETWLLFPTLRDNPMRVDLGSATNYNVGQGFSVASIASELRAKGHAAKARFRPHALMNAPGVRIGASIRQLAGRVPPVAANDPTATNQFAYSDDHWLFQNRPGGMNTLHDALGVFASLTPFTRATFERWDKENIYIGWCPAFVRAWIKYRNNVALHVRAGASDVAVGVQPNIEYVMNRTTATLGIDAAKQNMRGAVNFYGTAFVSNHLAVRKGYHASSRKCLGGMGTNYITIRRKMDWKNWDPRIHGSVMVLPLGPSTYTYPFLLNRFDITGRYHSLEAANFRLHPATERPDGTHYDCAAWVVAHYGLKTLAARRQRGPTTISANPTGVANTIVYMEMHVRCDRDGKMTKVIRGVGHHGEFQGPGNEAARNGRPTRSKHYLMALGLEATKSLSNGQ